VPVTARLSRKFYETFGEEIANELVDWFNAVDLTYRADLRELNELNFARFDAKLEQRIAELEARFERRWSELEAKFERRWAQLDARIDRLEVSVDAKLDRLKAELIKWMFLFWIGSVGLALGINALG
jgi:hypothetical protein